jgi:hypothetical protein
MQRLERVGRYNKFEKRLLLLAQHTLTVHELHRRRILELLGASARARSGRGCKASIHAGQVGTPPADGEP